MPKRNSVTRFFKNAVIGKERQLTERGLFHSLSLSRCWRGRAGADGLSSSCYGPEQAYKHWAVSVMSLFVA